jgi:hypothetical protein
MMSRRLFAPIQLDETPPRWLTVGQLDPNAEVNPTQALIGSITFVHTDVNHPLRDVHFLAYIDGEVRLQLRWDTAQALAAVGYLAVPLIRRPLVRIEAQNNLLTIIGRFHQRNEMRHFLATVRHFEGAFLGPAGLDQNLEALFHPYLHAHQHLQPHFGGAEERINPTPEIPTGPFMLHPIQVPQQGQVPQLRRIVRPLPDDIRQQLAARVPPQPPVAQQAPVLFPPPVLAQAPVVAQPAPIPCVNANRLEAANFQGEIPDEMICPISFAIIDRPVHVPGTAGIFNEAHIRQWLTRNPTNPLTRAPMHASQLVHHGALQAQIDAFVNQHAPILDQNEPLANRNNDRADLHEGAVKRMRFN